jgi:hypothetical protein
MNPRERILALVVLGILGVVLGGFLFHSFYLSPLQKSEESITSLQDQIEKKKARIAEIQAELPTYERWRALTLPSKLDVANLEYDKWLTNEIQKAGFVGPSVSPKPIDLKSGVTAVGAAAAKAPPVYAKMGFSVTGRATLANLVQFLDKFYSAGLLHQIRTISIQRPLTQVAQQQRNELDVTLSIEALSLTGADPRKTLLPVIDSRLLAIATVAALRHAPVGLALAPDALGPRGDLGPGKLATTERDYTQMAKKDIFFGRQGQNPPAYNVDVSRYYRLTDIIEGEERTPSGIKKARYANMVDLYNANRKIRLEVGKSSGYSDFAIREEDYSSIVFRGRVVKINDLDIVFQGLDKEGQPIKDNYFRLKIGGTMQEALRRSLTKTEASKEGLVMSTTPKKEPEEADDGH